TLRKEYKKLLNTLEFSDSKNTAYLVTRYAFIFKDDTPEHVLSFIKLSEKLQEYKYKKNVNAFNKDTLVCIEEYKSLVNA
ncbi:hypothetical protein JHD48_10515, partial [Sulfurimonas sp. SAG-AH-194-I05]|nr:hypothetical protein [Sulfurimonas sp. SAG-AH-194-I05]